MQLPAGRATQLVGCVAVHGGRCHVDIILEALWPAEDPNRSRTLLRKLLSKTNSAAGDLLARDGDVLSFVAETTIDLVDFDEESRRAIALGATANMDGLARARIALSKYRGDVLPDERYADWAIVPRERFRQRRNALLEVLIADADRRNDLQTALVLVEDLIAADPDEEGHYVTAARMLFAAGQLGRARSYLARADESLARLDLPRSDQHDAVRDEIGAARDS